MTTEAAASEERSGAALLRYTTFTWTIFAADGGGMESDLIPIPVPDSC